MIHFDRQICGDLETALRREWLETNGLGGFASSTIVGLNTRRYHGVLVAAIAAGRFVLLSKLEETLLLDGQPIELSANQYPGVVHPEGYRFLTQFRLDPFPVFTYEVDGFEIVKSVFMVQGENTTVVQYELTRSARGKAARSVALLLRPLIAFRDYHTTTHQNDALNPMVHAQAGSIWVSPYFGLPTLYLAHNAQEVQAESEWYRNFQYDAERERGLDFEEDLFQPCSLRFELGPNRTPSLIASTEPQDTARVPQLRQSELARRQAMTAASPLDDDFARSLSAASGQYLVNRVDRKTVIAGYHWFNDWGRDTMIALPGLALVPGRHDVARDILRTFACYVDQGMLPNRFPDSNSQPEYNTVDATLWFFEAARSYLAYSADSVFVRKELYAVFADIISWHLRGTRYSIKVDSDGLIHCGEPGVQLTWMDAKVGDWVVTPRQGKPVEIQALWYNALRIMEDFARTFGDEAGQKRYGTLAGLAEWSFNRLFWNDKGGYLYDIINQGTPDASIRPNQILAVSLPHCMLPLERAERVVACVQEHLLTPYGLRTLAPSDPQYRGRYTGDQVSRDGAYHQGTVWAWLMGPFLTAYLKVHGHRPAARDQASEWLAHLLTHLSDAGLGHVSEIFDGDAPHHPVGCIAQAWSTAEVLRAYVEDVHGARPGARSLVPARAGESAPKIAPAAAPAKLPAASAEPPAAPGPKTAAITRKRSGTPRKTL